MRCKFKITNNGQMCIEGLCNTDRPSMILEEIKSEVGWTIEQQRWDSMTLTCCEEDVRVFPPLEWPLQTGVECVLEYDNEIWDMSCEIVGVFADGPEDGFDIRIKPIAVGWHTSS